MRHYLRPPGVISEKDLKARCIACGQCAAVCNYACIVMSPDLLFGPDTPKVFHRKSPCFLCMKCGEICPTGALRNVPMQGAGMGLAFLDEAKCVDYQEQNAIMCWTCYERCPLKGEAITLQHGYIPAITDECVGCGVCEYVCPTKAISITPSRLLKKNSPKPEGGAS